MKKKILIFSILVFILIIFVLWITGVIPKYIAKFVASSYLNSNYNNVNIARYNIELSTKDDKYIVNFYDNSNNLYSFMLDSKYFPKKVIHNLSPRKSTVKVIDSNGTIIDSYNFN